SQPVEIDVGAVRRPELADRLRPGKYGVGDLFRGRPAISGVVLDAEILMRPAGIVAGRQDDAAKGLVLANDVGSGRSGEDTALPYHDPAKAVGDGDADGLLDDLPVVVAAIAADHQRLALE